MWCLDRAADADSAVHSVFCDIWPAKVNEYKITNNKRLVEITTKSINNNADVFILRRLYPDDNERIITTLHYI